MIVLLYALATVASVALAVRAPLANREDPVRRAYAVLGLLVGATWLGWTLHLMLPGLAVGKLINGTASVFLPWALLRFITQFFVGRDESPTEPRLARLGGLAPFVAVAYGSLELFVPWRYGQAGTGDVLLGTWVFYGFAITLLRLWQRHQASKERVQRARIRYLLALASAAIGFGFLEAIARAGSEVDPAAASFITQEGLVQGALPPLGALLTTTLLYFLYQMISLYRLLDLAEIFARVGAVTVAAMILVLLASLSAVSLSGPYPTHGIFQAFVASVLFLLGWDPLRNQLERWLGALLNPRGLLLGEAIRDVELTLPRAISVPALSATVLDRFVSSGRVPAAAIYLWDEDRRLYRLVAERGAARHPALFQVAREPFVDGFVGGEPAYLRVDLERQARRDTSRAERLQRRLELMAGMNADLVVPLPAGDLVLGWFAFADEEDGDGFSEEEIARLVRLGLQAAGTLENIHNFDALKEEHRLSALGTMAAGLAHEIRNPLAGIRGAAQFLETSRGGTDAEMVRVIVDETGRLNRIVAQFLEYARQLRVEPARASLRGLLEATARALAIEAARHDVDVVEECDPDLPDVDLDEDKLRQVLLNLGQNALMAMPNGGRLRLVVRRGALTDPRTHHRPAVEFVVQDNGVGIAPEDLDKLFVPFFTTRLDGTGLGLAICQRIVQAHHGEIDVRSAVGQGATFTVRIPLTESAGGAPGG
jgi:signal transduction histidine kinase